MNGVFINNTLHSYSVATRKPINLAVLKTQLCGLYALAQFSYTIYGPYEVPKLQCSRGKFTEPGILKLAKQLCLVDTGSQKEHQIFPLGIEPQVSISPGLIIGRRLLPLHPRLAVLNQAN